MDQLFGTYAAGEKRFNLPFLLLPQETDEKIIEVFDTAFYLKTFT